MVSYQTTYYAADGSVVDSYSTEPYYADTHDVVPESYGEVVLDAFCTPRFTQQVSTMP
jgi:hypothetical protein